MKLYFVTNTKKVKAIQKRVEIQCITEEKTNIEFKMTKNDFVVLSNEKGNLDNMEKLKNIILLTCDKTQKYIWRMIHQYKIIDIIDIDMDEKYIAERIQQVIRRNA